MSLLLTWDHETTLLRSPRPGDSFTVIKEQVVSKHISVVRATDGRLAVLKLARTPDDITSLMKEAQFYKHELLHLQGKYVPVFYGIFFGTLASKFVDMHEENRQVMLAACALHKAGVIHNNLVLGDHFITVGRSIRIVDFSKAERRDGCRSGTPILYPGRGQDPYESCPELMQLESAYGMFSGRRIPEPTLVNRMDGYFPQDHPLRVIGRYVGMPV
ncbi:hypothetical protein FB45DRAFT_1040819 [Roridomyces roridus]|uniref:Protein kinase domain-containing protein n=1 Tax=Roridomyces roridus TaxID=1738132 RepID=A0AAD7B120_9AGAR|nr:hypothetical protein FB45DRAFT_1040819 [Roridomyces roridus]